MNNVIQVAGVIDRDEAKLLIEAGVEYLGFPLRLPVNVVDHSEAVASSMIKGIKPPTKAVLICYEHDADEIISFLDFIGTNIIQLHGPVTAQALKQVKLRRPDITIFKSVVIGETGIEALSKSIQEWEEYVDAFITDTFNPATGASGATGLLHDWSMSQYVIKQTERPVILAGGLNADNVYDAICTVNPAGVDVHTGIENMHGRKDYELTQRFVSEAKRAFNRDKSLSHDSLPT